MYEIDNNLENYFLELEPAKRFELMPEDDFLRVLYDLRYSERDNRIVDGWLWRAMCLQVLYGRGKFFTRSRNREVMKIVDELQMKDHAHKNFLYHEYRNVARRYLSTCNSADYASSVFGFKKANDDEKIFKACNDIWQMSRGIAKSSGLENEMSVWCEAFHDELVSFDDSCREIFERL